MTGMAAVNVADEVSRESLSPPSLSATNSRHSDQSTGDRKKWRNQSGSGGKFLLSSLRRKTKEPKGTYPAVNGQAPKRSSQASSKSATSSLKDSNNALREIPTQANPPIPELNIDFQRDSSTEARSKESARLAALIMNLNLTNDEQPEHAVANTSAAVHANAAGLLKQEQGTELNKFSAATNYRARKTRTKIALEYQMIQNFQYHDLPVPDNGDQDGYIDRDDVSEDSNEATIKGVYNPLQTIRNRAFRPPTSGKEPSSVWKISPQEYLQDYYWQQRNQHLMRDRKGRLLIPKDSRRVQTDNRGYGDELIHRIKQRLGTRAASLDGSDSSFSDQEATQSTGASIRRSIDEGNLTNPPSPQLRRRSEDRERQKSISPVRGVTIEKVHHKYDLESRRLGDISLPPPPQIESVIEKDDGKSSALAHPPPRHKSVISQTLPLSERTELMAPGASMANELKYLDMVYFLSRLDVQRKKLKEAPLWHEDCDAITKDILMRSNETLNELMPADRAKLRSLEVSIQEIKSDLTENNAPRMDRVLSESDQLLKAVSTTMNLEARKTGERLDKLEGDAPSPVKWLTSLGYSALEWLLVVLMWVLWVFVSIILFLRCCVRAIIYIIRWLLWLE